jgi:hypothetical protein
LKTYHFGLQHGAGEKFAQATLSFFDYYDFDFLRVMNDYFYPPPEGLDAIDSAAGLERLQVVGWALPTNRWAMPTIV